MRGTEPTKPSRKEIARGVGVPLWAPTPPMPCGAESTVVLHLLTLCPWPPPTHAPTHPLQSGRDNVCLGFSENQCAGLCRSEERLEGIYRDCIVDPYSAGAHPATCQPGPRAGAAAGHVLRLQCAVLSAAPDNHACCSRMLQ